MTTLAPGQRLEQLRIDGVDDEGRGRCVVGGWDVAVRGGFPGDVVAAAIVEVVFAARRLAQVRRLDALQPSSGPLHVERACGHAGPCAACPLHGVDDGFARALKRARVQQAFDELLPTLPTPVVVGDVVDGEGLRQKVKLVAGGRAGAIRLGHFVPHSHHVAPAALCGVARDAIVGVVDALEARFDAHGMGPEVIKAVLAREFKSGVSVVVVGRGAPPVALSALRPPGCSGLAWRRDDARDDRDGNSLLRGDIVDVDGDALGDPLDGGPRCAVDAFCQADLTGAGHLVELACDFVVGASVNLAPAPGSPLQGRSGPGATFFDLYAGTGAFARALLARGAGHVVAVEVAGVSVEALAAIANVDAVAGRVEEVIGALRARGQPAGLVVDPPKKGLGDVAAAIAGLGAARIALVSCDVDAGARDARALVDGGYVIERVVPFDLFPGSTEVEVLTLLRRLPRAERVSVEAGVDQR